MAARSEHTFHIPVMGTAYTVDSPLRVARYGITSVISVVDDHLVENMRTFYLRGEGVEPDPIPARSPDARARRIQAWLDLVDRKVAEQTEALRQSPFEPGSEIGRYFELLPEGPGKALWRRMQEATDAGERARLQAELRQAVRPGRIEVNVMAKVDRERGSEPSDAVAALRGFVRSTVRGGIVLSAGMNPRLYGEMAAHDAFRRMDGAGFEKEIILKVSDFRSASIQGKYLAKRGLWVSEYRIESGINCGGHAFVSDGRSLALVLQDFQAQRDALHASLRPLYEKAVPEAPPPPRARVTVQGGIGTAEEDAFLRRHYEVEGTGWGTPFLLVPEAVLVDPATLSLLSAAGPDDVRLGDGSPFGVPFWSVVTAPSEAARAARNASGRPGTTCPKGYLASNTDYGDTPLCTAARSYQRKERARLANEPDDPRTRARLAVLDAKLCLCEDLAGVADRITGVNPDATPVVCAGPNLAGFRREAGLAEMVGHIYGRENLLAGVQRPHVLVRELELYADHLAAERTRLHEGAGRRSAAELDAFQANVLEGVRVTRALHTQRALALPAADLALLDGLEAALTEAPRAAVA